MTKERSSSIKRSQNSIVTLDREQSGLPTITLSERDWWFSEIDFSALVDEARNSRPSKASNKERQYRLAPGEERQGRRGCVGRVADGIRADLFFEYKVRAGRRWSYCYPVFMVDRIAGGTNKHFRISKKLPFPEALGKAVAHYSQQRGLGVSEIVELLHLVPERSVFLDIIVHRQAQGYDVPVSKILEKVELPSWTYSHLSRKVA